MKHLIGARLMAAVPVLMLVSVGAFAMVHLTPGTPAELILGEAATPERVAALNTELGYSDPLPTQFGRWWAGLLRGDLGTSLYSSRSITEQILERLPVTMALAIGSILLVTLLGTVAGGISAVRPGSRIDKAVSAVSMTALAIPSFFFGLLLLYGFAVELGWFPVAGYKKFSQSPSAWALSLVLPVLAIALHGMASVAKQARTALLEVLDRPFVQAARARGLSPRRVLWRHAWPSAAPPVLSVLGLSFAGMIGGAVVIENVFSLPGLGSYVVTATLRRDLPAVQGVVIVTTLVVLATNLIIDVVQVLLDPRVKAG